MSDGGKQYAAFIEAELQAENDRRSSINTRAAGGLTSAAGLVTLVLAVLAVVVGKDFTLSGGARNWLVAALIALLAAALLAVLAGAPWLFRATSPTTLRYFLDNDWGDAEHRARKRTTYCNVMVITAQRRGNRWKSYFLLASSICQGVAVISLAVCTISVLPTR